MKAADNTSAEATVIHRLLVGLVDRVYRSPWLVLALALGFAGLSAFASFTCLEYRTQRSDLVSPDKDYQKRWREYLAEFGDDDDIVIVVQGADRARMCRAIDGLAAEINRHPQTFDRLFYRVDLRPLRNRSLLFMPADQIRKIQEFLQSDDMRLLLEPALGGLGWHMVSLGQILDKAGRVARPAGAGQTRSVKEEQILAQLAAISRTAAATLHDRSAYRNPWQSFIPQGEGQKAQEQGRLLAEPQYFFSGDGKLAFMLVRPVKEEHSFTAAKKSVDAMRAILAAARPRFPGLEFGLTGLPVLETDEMVASEQDTHLASCLALAGVGLLFVFVYRGFRNPFLTLSTLLVGTAWAMGWVTLTVGHLNILSATFAIMLIGMGDYGVLWVTRYEQNRAAGGDVRTALRRTAAGGGPSILTAAAATALAFFAAMLADFQAVAELGWIAGSGVLLCAFSCFTVMPALLTLFDRRSAAAAAAGRKMSILSFKMGGQENSRGVPRLAQPWGRVSTAGTAVTHERVASNGYPPAPREGGDLAGNRSWLPGLARRPRWVIATGLALTACLGLFAFHITYDHNLLHLQDPELDSVRWEQTLIQHTAGANWHALSFTASAAEARVLKARFEQLDEVSRVVEVASLVPPGQEHKLTQLRDIQHRLRSLPERGAPIAHALPCPADLRQKLAALLKKLDTAGPGSPPLVAAELRQSLSELQTRLAALPDARAARRLRKFEEQLTGDLAENLHQLRDVSTPAAITLADLPPSLRERYVGKTGKWLLRVFAKDCLWDHAPLQNFAARIQAIDPRATGKPFSTLEGLRALKDGFQWAGLYALLAIVAIFAADFRNLRYTLLALAPLAMGVVISLGIRGLFGLPLNPANIIAFPLILGVGAVYGVHVVHDYLTRRRSGPYTLSYIIGRAILVMALTNMISFGTLMISRHRGLSGLGFTLMLGVACCMVTALVFLPAVLKVLSRRPARVVEMMRAEESRMAA
jgi:predicted RND superfamily exporter protein